MFINRDTASAGNPQDDGPHIPGYPVVAMSITVSFAGIFVFLRFWSRYLRRVGYKFDDWCCVAGMCFTLAHNVIAIKMVQIGGPGGPTESLYFKYLFTCEILYASAVAAIKLSILSLYQRIFGSSKKAFVVSLWISAGIVAAWWIANILVGVFACNPVSGFWSQDSIPPPVCIDRNHFFIGNSVPNILTDIFILVIPIFAVWDLKMTLTKKLSVIAILSLGLFVTIVSIVRILAFFEPTFTWAEADASIWTAFELDFAIICSCLPTLRIIFQVVLGKGSKNATSASRSQNRHPEPTHKMMALEQSRRRTSDIDGFELLVDSSSKSQLAESTLVDHDNVRVETEISVQYAERRGSLLTGEGTTKVYHENV